MNYSPKFDDEIYNEQEVESLAAINLMIFYDPYRNNSNSSQLLAENYTCLQDLSGMNEKSFLELDSL